MGTFRVFLVVFAAFSPSSALDGGYRRRSHPPRNREDYSSGRNSRLFKTISEDDDGLFSFPVWRIRDHDDSSAYGILSHLSGASDPRTGNRFSQNKDFRSLRNSAIAEGIQGSSKGPTRARNTKPYFNFGTDHLVQESRRTGSDSYEPPVYIPFYPGTKDPSADVPLSLTSEYLPTEQEENATPAKYPFHPSVEAHPREQENVVGLSLYPTTTKIKRDKNKHKQTLKLEVDDQKEYIHDAPRISSFQRNKSKTAVFHKPEASEKAEILRKKSPKKSLPSFSEPKKKRQSPHDTYVGSGLSGQYLDANGIEFVAETERIRKRPKGRMAFQIHGQEGPHSYRFGYDTGKGYDRQFRFEEKDGYGEVKGHYGYYDKNGKLQLVNYSAHPKHGFQADVVKSPKH